MNKKYNGWTAMLILFSVTIGFASDAEKATDKVRYNEIVDAFNLRRLQSDNIAADIAIVESHKQILVDKLAEKKKIVDVSYIPNVLKGAASAFAFTAAIGGFASLFTVAKSYTILNRSENVGLIDGNMGWWYAKADHDDDESKLVHGAGYFQMLRLLWSEGLMNNKITSPSFDITDRYMAFLPKKESYLTAIGLVVAPPLVISSLIFAGIAKYLFDKAASYKKEIVRLEEEIKRDEIIIKDLQTLKQ